MPRKIEIQPAHYLLVDIEDDFVVADGFTEASLREAASNYHMDSPKAQLVTYKLHSKVVFK